MTKIVRSNRWQPGTGEEFLELPVVDARIDRGTDRGGEHARAACQAPYHRAMFKPLVVAGALIAEADMRFAALDAGSFVGVTTRQGMIADEKRWVALGPEKVAADKAMRKTTFTGPVTSLKVVPFPAPVARQMHQIDADLAAFGAARVGYRPRKSPRAIGDTAQKLMRDIRAVLATCSQKH